MKRYTNGLMDCLFHCEPRDYLNFELKNFCSMVYQAHSYPSSLLANGRLPEEDFDDEEKATRQAKPRTRLL